MALVALMVGLTGCKSKTETALKIDSKTSTEVTEKATEGTTGEAREGNIYRRNCNNGKRRKRDG